MPIRGNIGDLKGEAIITLRVIIEDKEVKAIEQNKQLLTSIFT